MNFRRIRIFVEGGGKGKTRDDLRRGFLRFFAELKSKAAHRAIAFEVVMSGSSAETLAACEYSQHQGEDALCVALVDSEGPPPPVVHRSVHYMVELMETWFVADAKALQRYYGHEFQNCLSRSDNLEAVPKAEILDQLKRATANTAKGKYHKTHQAPQILERMNPEAVRRRCPACDRIFRELEASLQ